MGSGSRREWRLLGVTPKWRRHLQIASPDYRVILGRSKLALSIHAQQATNGPEEQRICGNGDVGRRDPRATCALIISNYIHTYKHSYIDCVTITTFLYFQVLSTEELQY